MLMALDIATTAGWAFGIPGTTRPLFGEHRMAPVGADESIVFDNFDRWLNTKIDVLHPQRVFAEDQFMAPTASRIVMQRLLGMRAICTMVCRRRGVRLRWVPVTTVQRFFTGQGRWPRGEKKGATMRVCRLYGWSPQTDNQADALAVWLFGEHDITPLAAARRSVGPIFARAG